MQRSKVFSVACGGLASCGLAAAGLLLEASLTSGVQAQSNPCAIYGDGFVPLHGGGTCVRIGGRVRVDGATAPARDTFGPGESLNFAPQASPGIESGDRGHLRAPGAPYYGMPRTR